MELNVSKLQMTYCTISANPDACETVITIRKVVAACSFVGCIFMILVIWLFRKYVVFAQRMILYLTIGALFDCIAYLMSSTIEDGVLCDIQAWWLTYFDWTVLLWVSCLTFNLFMNIIMTTTTESYEKLYHGICWGLPLLISLLPFTGNHYGPAGAWCWIKEDLGWRLGIWYVPLFVTIIILFVTYIYIIFRLRRQASAWEGTYDPDTERNHRMLKEDIKPLRFYPFVYLLVSIFPLVNRINNAINPGHDVFWLVVMASLSAPLHGVMNAIVFGMDRETMKKLTPSQIKVAFMAKLAPSTPVQEYPHGTTDKQTLHATSDILQDDTATDQTP
ncbi:hypothetical protein ACOMHN_058343 [Nucella lapillus]